MPIQQSRYSGSTGPATVGPYLAVGIQKLGQWEEGWGKAVCWPRIPVGGKLLGAALSEERVLSVFTDMRTPEEINEIYAERHRRGQLRENQRRCCRDIVSDCFRYCHICGAENPDYDEEFRDQNYTNIECFSHGLVVEDPDDHYRQIEAGLDVEIQNGANVEQAVAVTRTDTRYCWHCGRSLDVEAGISRWIEERKIV